MLLSSQIEKARTWLSLVPAQLTLERLTALLQDLKQREAAARVPFDTPAPSRMNRLAFKQWRRAHAQALQELQVIVPVRRRTVALLQRLALKQPLDSGRIALFLLSRITRTTEDTLRLSPSFTTRPSARRGFTLVQSRMTAYWLTPTHANTAQSLVQSHSALFGPLPEGFEARAPALPVQAEETRYAELMASKLSLRQKIEAAGLLTEQELTLLRRFLG